jgi:hypothetical protein
MRTRAQLARITRLLDAVYAEPDELASVEQFVRARHYDLAALTLDQIDGERILARLRCATQTYHGEPTSPWLNERIARLDIVAERLRKRAPR